ncbi:MAG: protease inhibitor I42 family protein [Methanobacteriota archaeon]
MPDSPGFCRGPALFRNETLILIGQKIQPSGMDRIAKFLILLVAALVLVPGCFAEEMNTTETAITTEVAEVVEVAETTNETVGVDVAEAIIPDFEANMSMSTLEMGVNQTVAIALTAEETEGIWNVTMTDGLTQEGNSTVTNGTEVWTIKAVTAGEQSFNAVHEAMSETATEAGETYKLDIIVA